MSLIAFSCTTARQCQLFKFRCVLAPASKERALRANNTQLIAIQKCFAAMSQSQPISIRVSANWHRDETSTFVMRNAWLAQNAECALFHQLQSPPGWPSAGRGRSSLPSGKRGAPACRASCTIQSKNLITLAEENNVCCWLAALWVVLCSYRVQRFNWTGWLLRREAFANKPLVRSFCCYWWTLIANSLGCNEHQQCRY